MADKFSTAQVQATKSCTSLPPRSPNLLRKRPITPKEQRKSPLHLGIKIRRLSELEPYSSQTRGTLGGFLSLNDLGRADSDISSVEKEKPKEKRCCLTALTKKIGLGIYVQARGVAGSVMGKEADEHPDPFGDERETWYMFYPPPPSPSVAFEPAKWDSDSSVESDLKFPSTLTVNCEAEAKTDNQSIKFTLSNDNLCASWEVDCNPEATTNSIALRQDTGISTLMFSAEQLAEQYRDLLVPPNPTPASSPFHSWAICDSTGPIESATPQIPVTRTIRKVKAQYSLRNPAIATGSLGGSVTLPTSKSSVSIISNSSKSTRIEKKTKRTTQPPIPPPRDSSLRHTAIPATPRISPFDDFQFPFSISECAINERDDLQSRYQLLPPIQPLKLRPRSPTDAWCVNNHAESRTSEETTRHGTMNSVGGGVDGGGWL